MHRKSFNSIVAALICLALVPALWVFARIAIPPFSAIVEETSGGRVGPWFFTWALIWVAALSALVVAWLSYSSRNNADL